MKLFPFVGQPQPGTRLEEKRVGELIGSERETGRVSNHGEEQVESFNGVGALGVSSENGVVMERSWGGKRAEEEAGISEVARGGESGEGEELGKVVGVA